MYVYAYFTLLLNKYIRGKNYTQNYNSPCCSCSSQVCLSPVWGTGTQFPLPLRSPIHFSHAHSAPTSHQWSIHLSSFLLSNFSPSFHSPLVLSFPSRGHFVTSLLNTATGPLRAFQLDSSNCTSILHIRPLSEMHFRLLVVHCLHQLHMSATEVKSVRHMSPHFASSSSNFDTYLAPVDIRVDTPHSSSSSSSGG